METNNTTKEEAKREIIRKTFEEKAIEFSLDLHQLFIEDDKTFEKVKVFKEHLDKGGKEIDECILNWKSFLLQNDRYKKYDNNLFFDELENNASLFLLDIQEIWKQIKELKEEKMFFKYFDILFVLVMNYYENEFEKDYVNALLEKITISNAPKKKKKQGKGKTSSKRSLSSSNVDPQSPLAFQNMLNDPLFASLGDSKITRLAAEMMSEINLGELQNDLYINYFINHLKNK